MINHFPFMMENIKRGLRCLKLLFKDFSHSHHWRISIEKVRFSVANMKLPVIFTVYIASSIARNILHDCTFDWNSIEIQKSVSVSRIHLRFPSSKCRKYRLRITFSVIQLGRCATNEHWTILWKYTDNLIFLEGVIGISIRISIYQNKRCNIRRISYGVIFTYIILYFTFKFSKRNLVKLTT